VHLPPNTEVVLRCTPGGLLMRETGCRFLQPLRPHALSLTLPSPTSVRLRPLPHRCLPLRHVHHHYVPVALFVGFLPRIL